MIYKTDYHIHTLYSDGHGRPEEYIPFAVKEGVSELGFSDHLTLTDKQQDWSIDPAFLDSYYKEISDLGKKYRNIMIRLGLEVDYLPGKEKDISSIINSYPFDYIIGSVHYVGNETVDLGPGFYEGKDLYLLYREYFELVSDAAGSGLFDIIGHPDLVRIFNYMPAEDIRPLYSKLASSFNKSDIAFEINTNGKNKPLKDIYPNPAFLGIFRNANVPVCVNSDSHNPYNVGQYFDEAYAMAIRSGYDRMAIFEKRTRSYVKIY